MTSKICLQEDLRRRNGLFAMLLQRRLVMLNCSCCRKASAGTPEPRRARAHRGFAVRCGAAPKHTRVTGTTGVSLIAYRCQRTTTRRHCGVPPRLPASTLFPRQTGRSFSHAVFPRASLDTFILEPAGPTPFPTKLLKDSTAPFNNLYA